MSRHLMLAVFPGWMFSIALGQAAATTNGAVLSFGMLLWAVDSAKSRDSLHDASWYYEWS